MTLSSGEFRIEGLENTLNELQNEKKFLQSSLDQYKNKRLQLEHELESVNSKHTQLSDLHRKLSVTLQIGYHKVAQTQNQILSLEEHIQNLRDAIKTTLKIISEQRTNQLNNIKELETKLSDIAQKLRNAKTFYSESNLSTETNLILKKQKETNEKILTVKADVHSSKEEQQQWQHHVEEFKSNFMEGFTASFKESVWNIFELENKIYNQEYLALKEEFETLKASNTTNLME